MFLQNNEHFPRLFIHLLLSFFLYNCTNAIRLKKPYHDFFFQIRQRRHSKIKRKGETLSITSHYLITNDFTNTPSKRKNNNCICRSFKGFDILVEVSHYAISFSLIIKDIKQNTLHPKNGSTIHLKFWKTASVFDDITFKKPWLDFLVFTMQFWSK